MMESPEQRFARRLPDYLASLEGTSHNARRIHFLDLVRRLLSAKLAKIDALAREVLGMA